MEETVASQVQRVLECPRRRKTQIRMASRFMRQRLRGYGMAIEWPPALLFTSGLPARFRKAMFGSGKTSIETEQTAAARQSVLIQPSTMLMIQCPYAALVSEWVT